MREYASLACTCMWAGDPQYRPRCPVHEPPCPQCSRFREKLNRERIMEATERCITHEEAADALIAYLTE